MTALRCPVPWSLWAKAAVFYARRQRRGEGSGKSPEKNGGSVATRWCPHSDVCWFIIPMNTIDITPIHQPEWNLTSPWKIQPFLRTVNHLFLWAILHGYVKLPEGKSINIGTFMKIIHKSRWDCEKSYTKITKMIGLSSHVWLLEGNNFFGRGIHFILILEIFTCWEIPLIFGIRI